jgi:hypothetical protein
LHSTAANRVQRAWKLDLALVNDLISYQVDAGLATFGRAGDPKINTALKVGAAFWIAGSDCWQ